MHHPRRSKRGLVALAVAAMLLVPAAIAWACNPQAQLTPNKASYTPGETATVSGSFFPRGVAIKVTVSNGASATATANQSGAFQISGLAIPSAPGTYTITATRADGAAQSGLPKVASFSVAAPIAKTAPAPSATPTPTAQREREERAFVEPSVTRSPTRSVAGGTGGGSGGGGQPIAGNTGGVAGGGTTVVGTTGVPVFAGSVAPAQATFGNPATAGKAKDTAARSTGRASATDSDVWSGFANGRTPSLTSDAADAPDSDTGSGLGLGIGLLAVGLLALVAGLTAAEVRRRRASV
jgi:hypothetical protein